MATLSKIADGQAAASSIDLSGVGISAGDLVVIHAYRNGSTTVPSSPGGNWTDIATSAGANTNSRRIGYRVIQSGDNLATISGTWTNATAIQFLALRGQHLSTPIGASASGGTNTTTLTTPALTLTVQDGTSWVIAFAGSKATNANTVTLSSTTDETSSQGALNLATGRSISTWASRNYSATVNASGNRMDAVEIEQAPPITGSFTADAIVLVTQSASFTADAIIDPLRFPPRTDIRAAGLWRPAPRLQFNPVQQPFRYFAVATASFTADAVILVTQSGSFTADAELASAGGTVEDDFTADAIKIVWGDPSETWTTPIGAASFTADAIIRTTISQDFTENAVLLRTGSATIPADSVILNTATASFTADSVIRVSRTGDFTADAVLRAEAVRSLLADAIVFKTISGGWTADAAIQRTQSFTLTADAAIRASQSATFTANAVIQSTITSSFTADAVKRTTQTASFTADAAILVVYTFSADAVILRETTAALSGNAVLLRTQSVVFTADAIVRSTSSATLDADAVLVRTVSAAFSADAVIFGANQFDFTADASIDDGLIRDPFDALNTADQMGGSVRANLMGASISAGPMGGSLRANSMGATISVSTDTMGGSVRR